MNLRITSLRLLFVSLAVLFILLVTGIVIRLHHPTPSQIRLEPVLVEATIQDKLSNVATLLKDKFGKTSKGSLPTKLQPFILVDTRDPLFPTFETLSRLSGINPDLEAYLQRYSESHDNDYYLFDPSGDVYWSTTNDSGQTLKEFRTGFLIHFQNQASTSTSVSVFEYLPQMRNGKSFSVGHAGPGFYWNITPAPPTSADKRQILSLITRSNIGDK